MVTRSSLWKKSEKKRTVVDHSVWITIRSGGNNGSRGGVTIVRRWVNPMAKSVLGHADETSLVDIWYGEEYEKLREGHRTGVIQTIVSLATSCTIISPVWSNDSEAKVDHMLGTDFDLR